MDHKFLGSRPAKTLVESGIVGTKRGTFEESPGHSLMIRGNMCCKNARRFDSR